MATEQPSGLTTVVSRASEPWSRFMVWRSAPVSFQTRVMREPTNNNTHAGKEVQESFLVESVKSDEPQEQWSHIATAARSSAK